MSADEQQLRDAWNEGWYAHYLQTEYQQLGYPITKTNPYDGGDQ